jgi:hypothetical protein
MKNKTSWLKLAFIFFMAACVITASIYQKKLANYEYSHSMKNKSSANKINSNDVQVQGELLIWEVISRRLLFFNQ